MTASLRAVSLAVLVSLGAAAPLTAAAQVPLEHLHVTVPGDTLIGIGRQLLAEPRRWRAVARLNRIADPDRIPVGARLRIPVAWMRTEPRPATLLGSIGTVQAPATLDEGSEVVTGDDGHAVVRLVDGTVLRLRPRSRLGLTESRVVPDTPVTRARARLGSGRVEVDAAPARGGEPGFRIDTPQGVLGVRGTRFRVASDTEPARSRGEVTEGVVAVSGAVPGQQRVQAGFGTVIDTSGRVADPVRLLPAPDLAPLPRLQERVLVRFVVPTPAVMAGVVAWRAQLARDARFEQVLGDLRVAHRPEGSELRFVGLPDGDYLLRVRGVDALGLEGLDADLPFRLKARPEPPLPSAPAPRHAGHRGAGQRHRPAARRRRAASRAGVGGSDRQCGRGGRPRVRLPARGGTSRVDGGPDLGAAGGGGQCVVGGCRVGVEPAAVRPCRSTGLPAVELAPAGVRHAGARPRDPTPGRGAGAERRTSRVRPAGGAGR
ncbi:FecR domain-containing protein [Rubrivivax albus]|uniref:FecR protein domain-containing protein n=1 Tax=Rubrivivax albus TaxID=2499835 RepID=A0A3S2WWE9_9BURK|nr:FecR domain-containing protein [Rubrivivax albus]RVT53345.1 hypothetical protein ENE75_00080 [Rubrivivax albus]